MKISVSVRPCTEDDPQHNGACSTMRIPGVSRQPRYTGQWQKVYVFHFPRTVPGGIRTMEFTAAVFEAHMPGRPIVGEFLTRKMVELGATARSTEWRRA